MREAGRERQSHLWRVEGSGGKKREGKMEDGVEKEKAGKEVRQGMHSGYGQGLVGSGKRDAGKRERQKGREGERGKEAGRGEGIRREGGWKE